MPAAPQRERKTAIPLRPAALVAAAALCLWATAPTAAAFTYSVDRSFAADSWQATLQGVVEIPLGSYTIAGQAPSPFTAVDLTLTFNGAPYRLTNVFTDYIYGSGQFLIDATPTSLVFNTAFADAFNPADLAFSDSSDMTGPGNYAIGYDFVPGFETARTWPGVGIVPVSFPCVFATVVPEPSAMALLGLGWLLFRNRKREARRPYPCHAPHAF